MGTSKRIKIITDQNLIQERTVRMLEFVIKAPNNRINLTIALNVFGVLTKENPTNINNRFN
ncbi:hypothetical protein A2331_00015 [Candidatus Falkowbacteria bacterium RIFOXYB2_FULL_34_18]|uniref:Uncharacterized protein n=1 Tax=Candidatus Falkowbacteria bacterium RIFOXYD2_FULL_34_120 TaxID=1798007 RepID=A0A1F5TSF8_9BACT|nr:MAG: hypothetical protein A2331_00015 [Candidatus Falkowbacteria bacterium RIFOXYB2_FULL_34_18]OGF29789.1 MAG: hypothetical protein A2500_01330 [Candidatus Falkowbacteria bacterium RIFOXYC12_FULL_34_55]OGF37481.1 MAG: hypothetical protein A2466_00575 [Candidatus Falkowbacteria bacterium RIFOXYC2_FULL_34_220]OGF39191.1 MAG: hypothetical protein A2515_01085 [Candidatus Falkowbacteria bacterium RIFOXYD12_FULL_34_57]OGF41758.1 MAG: hypothetical protein A2531_05745 [Candidatus Falkowbacteria bact